MFALSLAASRLQWPMRVPLPWHDVLDPEHPPRNALTSKSCLSFLPASEVVFNGLEHHASASSSEAAIGG